MRNPKVFMDLSLNSGPPKRVVIELFADVVPKTAENFRALCTGEMGIGETTKKPLHYKGCVFHHFYKYMALEGGDFSNHDGTGGESIYGGTFPAESNPMGCSGPGVLMTVNQRPRATGSLFLICFQHSVFLEGGNAAFGRIIEGMETVSALARTGTFGRVEVIDCGEVIDEPKSSTDGEGLNALWERWCSNQKVDISIFRQLADEVRANHERLTSEQTFTFVMPELSASKLHVTHKKPTSDSSSKRASKLRGVRIRGRDARISSLRNRSREYESPDSEAGNSIMTGVDEEKEIEKVHAPPMSHVELLELNAQEKAVKRTDAKVGWPAVALMILAGAVFFSHRYRVHHNN